MRRIIRRLGIALLTFCAGLAISHLFLVPLPVSRETANSRGALKDHLPHGVPLRNPGSQGCVLLVPERANGGYAVASTTFSWLGNSGFVRESSYFDSPGQADREMRLALSRATKIMSLKTLVAKDLKGAGRIAIAAFPPQSEYGPAAIVWTEGTGFRYIRHASLEKIQELSRNVNVVRCVPFCFDE